MPRVRKDNDARYANAVAFEQFKDTTTQDIADALTTKLDNTTDTLTGDLTVTGQINSPSIHLSGADSLSFEDGNHWITFNDGTGNFNVRVGHYDNAGGIEETTEAGYVFHESWSQSSGTWTFKVSDISTTAGQLNGTDWSWREQLAINQNEVSLSYQGSTKLSSTATGVTVTGDVAASTVLLGPNSSSKYLQIGGDAGVDSATTAGVVTTNGNLHIDSATANDIYMNWYGGDKVHIGNGSAGYGGLQAGQVDCTSLISSGAVSATTYNGYAISSSATANTIALRQANGYLFAAYYNSTGTFSTTGAATGMARFTGTNGSDTYGRSYTAAAAGLLIGQSGGMSDIRTDLVVGGSYRDHGVFGTYVSTKTQHIWSMGVAYRSSPAGTDFGNLYGAAYKHTNNATGGAMAGGHMMVWCQNGVGTAAIGTNIWTSGNVTAYSDIRVKTNIEVIPNALDKIDQLGGYTFDRTDIAYDEDGEPTVPIRQTGVIAQEVLEVLPEAVVGDEDHYSVAYGNMVGLLIEGIKELRAEVEELKRPWYKKLLGVR